MNACSCSPAQQQTREYQRILSIQDSTAKLTRTLRPSGSMAVRMSSLRRPGSRDPASPCCWPKFYQRAPHGRLPARKRRKTHSSPCASRATLFKSNADHTGSTRTFFSKALVEARLYIRPPYRGKSSLDGVFCHDLGDPPVSQSLANAICSPFPAGGIRRSFP